MDYYPQRIALESGQGIWGLGNTRQGEMRNQVHSRIRFRGLGHRPQTVTGDCGETGKEPEPGWRAVECFSL